MVHPAKRPVWIALASAMVFHILLLSLQANNRPGPGFMRLWLLDGLVPLERLADYGVRGVYGFWSGYINLIHVRADNQRLLAENNRLKMQLQSNDEALKEAGRLRQLYGLSETGIGKPVVARVIGRDPSLSLQTVTIDRGLASGVKLNASVITPDGVVGRVMSVGNLSAVVQLVTDTQSSTAVMLRDTRVQAVFKGSGRSDLELDYIDSDSDIAEGNELITSGLDRIHPKGLPVATIASVGPRRGLFKVVLARPNADMRRLEEVLVLVDPPAFEPEQPQTPPSPPPANQANERPRIQ
jgi:rod shape-determining protein MreC